MALTSNPAGSPIIRDLTPKPPKVVSAEVEKLRDPNHTESDFLRDLDKATQKRTKA